MQVDRLKCRSDPRDEGHLACLQHATVYTLVYTATQLHYESVIALFDVHILR